MDSIWVVIAEMRDYLERGQVPDLDTIDGWAKRLEACMEVIDG